MSVDQTSEVETALPTLSTRAAGRTDPQFARELVALGYRLRAESDSHALLLRALDGARECISGADGACVGVADHGRLTCEAQTEDVSRELHSVQTASGCGPCLEATQGQAPVLADDLTSEQRWPDFTARAVEQGVRSVLSVPLFVDVNVLGAVTFYAGEPRTFSADDEGAGLLLASQISMSLAALRARGNFNTALSSRDMIGQAKGILMERFKISDQEAFRILVAVSQRKHVKLRDVADELTRTGELDI